MTTTFLDQIAQHIEQTYGEQTSELCVVFTTRRAVQFFREALTKSYQQTIWAPKIFSIQDFLRSLSGYQFPEALSLIFELYQVFLKHSPTEPFEQFYPFGEMLLKDFDELDKYLVDAQQLFANLRDLKQLDVAFSYDEEQEEMIRAFWESFRPDEPTPIQHKFLEIWERLLPIYQDFRAALHEKQLAYDGMAYREVDERLEKGELEFPYKHVVFAGFNVLSAVEERLMKFLLDERKATVFWDADDYFFDGKNPAGKFIWGYHQKWKERDSRVILHDMMSEPKEVFVTGVPTQVGQAKFLGNLLQKEKLDPKKLRDHAIVLADENLLFPTLYALPQQASPVNITMGFPLNHTNIYNLLLSTTQLASAIQYDADEKRSFHHKAVTSILSNPYIKALYPESSLKIEQDILRKNLIQIPENYLIEQELPPLLADIFKLPRDWKGMLAYLQKLLENLLEQAQEKGENLEAEYVFQFYKQLNLLKDILQAYPFDFTINTFNRLFRQVIRTVRIPFEGEPLEGLQLMGFLESRTLDFQNVYLLAVNEGKLPGSNFHQSLIPYSLRSGFGMPTFEDKDSLYAYHFFRLMQRAKRVHLMYNTEVKSNGSPGEVSRFIRQLRYYFPKHEQLRVKEQILSTPTPYFEPVTIEIPFNEAIQDKLTEKYTGRKRFKNFLSYSALTKYITCPLQFYLSYVAEIREPDALEETMESSTFGTVMHETMERVYQPYLGKDVADSDFVEMKKRIPQHVQEVYEEKNLGTDELLSGKNRLYRTIIERMCGEIVQADLRISPFNVFMLEEEKDAFLQILKVNGREVKLGGRFDRVDYLPEEDAFRIIDYKTGDVKMGGKRGQNPLVDCFTDPDLKLIFQGYFYAWLFKKRWPERKVKVAYYSGKKMREGLLYLQDGQIIEADELAIFERHLTELLAKLLSHNFPQVEDEKPCEYCIYRRICNRGI